MTSNRNFFNSTKVISVDKFLENVLFDICPGTNVVGCSSVSLGCSSGNGWISCQNKDISGALHLNDDMSNVTHIYLHKNKSKRIYFFRF